MLGLLFVRLFQFISNHKPRKGTETECVRGNNIDHDKSFQTTNPARGRKRYYITDL